MKFLLLFLLPFLASAGPNGGRYTVREWSVVKSVPLMVRDYVGLINDFTVCRHCAEGVPDARFITRRPAQSIDEIVSGLAERAIPQLLGLMEIVTKTGEVVTVKYGTPDAKNLSIAGDVEHHSKSWYVLMRLSQMRNRLRSLAEEGTVYGRATNYGAELKERFNTRFVSLNESLAVSHGNLTTLTQRLFKAEVNAEPMDLSLQARRQFELRQDQVSKEAAWALLDFMSSILVPNRHVDACLYGANPPDPRPGGLPRQDDGADRLPRGRADPLPADHLRRGLGADAAVPTRAVARHVPGLVQLRHGQHCRLRGRGRRARVPRPRGRHLQAAAPPRQPAQVPARGPQPPRAAPRADPPLEHQGHRDSPPGARDAHRIHGRRDAAGVGRGQDAVRLLLAGDGPVYSDVFARECGEVLQLVTMIHVS
ncbi:hypothetical protein PG987_015521 [Apiospora arundinis]